MSPKNNAFIVTLSQASDFVAFTEIGDEAKRRQIAKSLTENGYSFQKSAKILGYTNGGLYGTFKLLFNARTLGAGKKEISDFLQNSWSKAHFQAPYEDLIDGLSDIPDRKTLNDIIDSAEKIMFTEALAQHNHNRLRTSETMRVSGRTMTDKIRKHDIFVPEPDYGRPTPPNATLTPKETKDSARTLSVLCDNEETLDATYKDCLKHTIMTALEENKYNLSNTAIALGIGRKAIKLRVEKLFGIDHFNAENLRSDLKDKNATKSESSQAMLFMMKSAPTLQTLESLHAETKALLSGSTPTTKKPLKEKPNAAPLSLEASAQFIGQNTSYQNLSLLRQDMTSALLVKTIIQNQFDIEQSAQKLELDTNSFKNACKNYLGRNVLNTLETLQQKTLFWRPRTEQHTDQINDYLPLFDSYSGLKQFFSEATKTALKKEWEKEKKNTSKAANNLGLEERDLYRRLQNFGLLEQSSHVEIS